MISRIRITFFSLLFSRHISYYIFQPIPSHIDSIFQTFTHITHILITTNFETKLPVRYNFIYIIQYITVLLSIWIIMSFFISPLFNSSSNTPELQNSVTSTTDLLSVIGTWIAVLLALLTIISQVYKYFIQNSEVSGVFFSYSKLCFCFVLQSTKTDNLQPSTTNNTFHLTQINNHFNDTSNGMTGDMNTVYSYTIEEVAWF